MKKLLLVYLMLASQCLMADTSGMSESSLTGAKPPSASTESTTRSAPKCPDGRIMSDGEVSKNSMADSVAEQGVKCGVEDNKLSATSHKPLDGTVCPKRPLVTALPKEQQEK